MCSYNKPLDLNLISSTKDITSNTVIFSISIGPALKVLDTFNFSQIITTNIADGVAVFTYSKGILTVSVTYNQSIQAKSVTLELSPPTIFNNTFDMKLSNSKFTVAPENSDAYYYPSSLYDQSKAVNYIYLICTGVGLLLCAVTLRRLIGLELMSMLQLSFFSLALVSKLHPIYAVWG